MDEHKKHIEDLSEIRSMMEKASKFISLSGLAGILAGVFAIIGAGIAYWYLEVYLIKHAEAILFESWSIKTNSFAFLLLDAVIIFCLAFASAIFFTTRRSKKHNLPLWDHSSKKMLVNLAIPLTIGALFIFGLVYNEYYSLIIPSSLIFYGLSLINAGHFTYSDIKYLGYFEIVIGFISLILNNWGIIIWAIGFGILHIVYGIVMFYKYER